MNPPLTVSDPEAVTLGEVNRNVTRLSDDVRGMLPVIAAYPGLVERVTALEARMQTSGSRVAGYFGPIIAGAALLVVVIDKVQWG